MHFFLDVVTSFQNGGENKQFVAFSKIAFGKKITEIEFF